MLWRPACLPWQHIVLAASKETAATPVVCFFSLRLDAGFARPWASLARTQYWRVGHPAGM